VNQPRRFAGCTNIQLLCQLDQHQTCLSVKMRAERTNLRNLSNRAKVEEECDGEIKEYEVATSAAKAHRCSRVKLASTYACNAAAALSSHPSSAVLKPVPILRTTKTVFPQHALVNLFQV